MWGGGFAIFKVTGEGLERSEGTGVGNRLKKSRPVQSQRDDLFLGWPNAQDDIEPQGQWRRGLIFRPEEIAGSILDVDVRRP